MALEVEARFRALAPEPLESLRSEATLGGAALGPARTVSEQDRYLDTDDGRLRAARWACRLRLREGRTTLSLKGPPSAPTVGWLHSRPEIEGPATESLDPDTWPDSPALAHLRSLSGGAPLSEWMRLVQARTERAVRAGDRLVGSLSLDAVAAHRADERLGDLYLVELEIEADGDPERDLTALAAALASRPGLSPEPRTKIELAIELAADRS